MDLNGDVITVTSTVTEKCAANTVRIIVTVRGEAKKYASAISEADARADSAVTALSAAGISLRGGGISVNTVVDEKKNNVYCATRTFYAQFAFDGALLEKAVDALSGIDATWNVSFVFEDENKRRELLNAAVKEARADAETIAVAAGVKLGGLAHVDYAEGGAHPVMLRAAFGGGEPEEISVSQSVTCSWRIIA